MIDRWSELAKSIKKPDTLVVNLYGGPGIGKSTVAALTFGLLKDKNINAELVTEYAKQLIWHERHNMLEDQLYILAKQSHYTRHLIGKVDVIVTDAPILLAKIYAKEPEIHSLAQKLHDSWRTFNVFISRDNEIHPYSTVGRTQKSVTEAIVVDRKILDMIRISASHFTLRKNFKSPLELAEWVVEDTVNILEGRGKGG